MSAYNHCLVAARESLSYFTNEELDVFLSDVFAKARSYTDVKGPDAVSRAIEEVKAEKDISLFESFQRQVENEAKETPMQEAIKNKKATYTEFVARMYKNLSHNIESAQKSARKRLSDAFFGKLNKDEFDYILQKDKEINIVQAIDGKANTDSIAKSIAQKFKEYIPFRNGQMVLSGALSPHQLNADRFLRATHNPALLMNGGVRGAQAAINYGKRVGKYIATLGTRDYEVSRNTWREFIKNYLNLEKTFKGTKAIGLDGKLNLKEADNILNDIYNNIITEKPDIFSFGKGNQEMFFYWKDMESWHHYAQKYGRKDLFASILADVNQSGNKIGTTEIFGSSPQTVFNRLAETQQKVAPVSKYKSRITKETFNYLNGIDQAAVSPTIANFGSTLRALTSMKALGRVTLVSLPDIANGVSFAKRFGYDYFSSYTDYMTGLFNALPNDERKMLASMFKEMTDHHMGYVSRFIDSNNVLQLVHTASTYFYRIVGLDALDKGNKISAIYMHAKNLGRMSKGSWEELPDLTRQQLNKYDITKQEWEVLRKKSKKELFTLENVTDLTDEEIRKMYGATSDQPLHLLKSSLHRKIYTLFDVASENVALKPGAYMRTWMIGGYKAGTIAGELMRTFMQFKQYSISYLDKVMYQGFKDADGATAKLGYMMMLTGSIMPMSFLSYYLNNLAQGKSLPSWDAMSWQQKVHMSTEILLPPSGLFNSFFYKQNQGRGLAINSINTPALQELSYAMSSVVALAGGDKEAFQKYLKKTASGVTPGLSLPFLDPYFKKALGEKAHLQPGQIQLYGQ